MPTTEELELQWQATRYAIDAIDTAWSLEAAEYNYSGDLYEQKKSEMKKHRDVLCKLQNQILLDKYQSENK